MGMHDNRRHRRSRRVKCVETGTVYPSAKAAADAIGGSVAGISHVITGRRDTHKGYTFVWYGLPEFED